MDAHEQRQKHPHPDRGQRQEKILEANNLVIQTKNVLADEALRSVRVKGSRGCHLLLLRLPCRQPLVEIFPADYFYHAVHFVVTQPAEFSADYLVCANLVRCEVHMDVESGNRILLES